MDYELARSAILVRQVLVSGQVRDALTPEHGPRGVLRVRLLDRDGGADYPLPGKVGPDGSYAFFGVPEMAFPLLTSQTYRLRVEASAPGYIAAEIDFDLASTAGQPADVVYTPLYQPAVSTTVHLFTATLPRQIDMSLSRDAVRLRGRVVRADDPASSVSGAQVMVGAHTALTDAEGFFLLASPLPVVLSVPISVNALGFASRVIDYEPDYTQPVNTLVILMAA
jgi:hypothetical protein